MNTKKYIHLRTFKMGQKYNKKYLYLFIIYSIVMDNEEKNTKKPRLNIYFLPK